MKNFVSILKKYPLSPFALVFFIYIHTYLYAYKWMLISDLYMPFIITLSVVSLLFFFLYKVYHSPLNAAIITSLLTLFFFYFGFAKDYFIKLTGNYLHLRYSIPVVFVILLFAFLKFRKTSPEKVIKLNYFFNLLFFIYIIVDIGIISFNFLTTPEKSLSMIENYTGIDLSKIQHKDSNIKPDVYFLVFDEYSSTESLKQNYGFDNSSLDSFLLSKGFYISNHSKSNYTYTIFSLSSTFNMNYFKNGKELNYPDDFGLVWKYMYQNNVCKLFEKEGYNIKNFSFFNIEDHASHAESISKAWALRFLFGKSLFSLFNIGYLWIDKKYYTHLLEKKLAIISTEIQSENEQPKFMYIHFLLPHHPYIFNKDGSERSVFDYTKTGIDKNKYYTDQLFYTNSVIKNLITKILSSDKKKIIILEGDHGNRFYTLPDPKAKAKYFSNKNDFKNLNAYYFYDKNYSKLYDSISPVNSFRVVFSQYLNKPYTLLKDSIVF